MSAQRSADLSRRHFLRLTAGGAVGLSLLVDACTSTPSAPKPSTSSTPAASGPANPLPTYVPPSGGLAPDFHSADPRITDGFLNFPKSPAKSWNAPAPGSGGTV